MGKYVFDYLLAKSTIVNDVEWIDTTSNISGTFPKQWRAVLSAPTPSDRIDIALSQWGSEIRTMLPRFMSLLQSELIDVAAARLDDEQYSLLYITKDGDEYASWIGTDPQLFGSESAIWDKLPEIFQKFLRNTHPSFGLNEFDAYGFTHPSRQVSIYKRTELAEIGVPKEDTWVGEYEGAALTLDDLYQVSWDTQQNDYVTSLAFKRGELAVLYEGDLAMADFWASLDEMLCMGYQNIQY